jgi:AcrR family transcriptional regulator
MASSGTSRRTRADKRAANQDRLLDAAMRVFAERGYHGATVEEIARESGLSNGALYYNFASKEKLFLALMDRRMEARIADLARTFDSPAESVAGAEASVREATDDAYRTGPEPHEWALFFEFVAHAGRDAEFRREFRKRLRRMRAILARTVDAQIETLGTPLSLPPEHVAVAMQALSYGLAAQRLADRPSVPGELYGRLLVALFRGLAE